MNRYIINEEQLKEVFEHADWGMTNFQKFKDKLPPCPNEQGAALGELIKFSEDYESKHYAAIVKYVVHKFRNKLTGGQ